MAYVAIGANLPRAGHRSVLQGCLSAAADLARLPHVNSIRVSRWYETIAQPPSGQPNYINAVAHLDCGLSPEALLSELQALETRAGRVRGAPNAARILDLDIVAMGSLVRAPPAADPVVPHPRMHLRGFVLVPLADVAPHWRHPLLGLTALELLAALPGQGVRPLEERDFVKW